MKTILLILALVLHLGPGFGENLDQTSVQTVDSQVTVEQLLLLTSKGQPLSSTTGYVVTSNVIV